ncbi:nudix hydrolase 9-like [Hibiscus syriacus]|uniref:Exocyst subunit Exo70 family protein n=1 Tax=Hibiscus syriacus TaxID=106335 RepID=A0A6A3CUP5_HIBSY|nr:nudix hydrolase 9-like [Hibiscus syriacus]
MLTHYIYATVQNADYNILLSLKSLLNEFTNSASGRNNEHLHEISISDENQSFWFSTSPYFHRLTHGRKHRSCRTTITKWDSLYGDNNAPYCNIASLFSGSNREEEAKQYLSSIKGLQKAMHYLASHQSGSDQLVRAQTLMQTAMKRLEREFHQILKSSRNYLDPESVSTHSSSSRPSVSRSSFSDFDEDDESNNETEPNPEVERVSSAAMADLRDIAEAMISAGYDKECFKIYKTIRKTIVDEALYNLGVERALSFQQIQKMEWEALEVKIKNWLNAVKPAVKTMFNGERVLCDKVFAISPAIRESCFTDILREGALALFGFPENVAKCKRTPEKMFRILDLYEAVSDLWPEIESIFSFESTSVVRSTAVNSLVRLGDAVRTMLTDFETAIQKDSSKTTVPGGGIHPLTRYRFGAPGYDKECFKIYKTIRKTIVDEALYNLGVERALSFQQIQKMEWEALEVKIKNWLNAVKPAVKTMFNGERVLCDKVFAISPAIRESCFTDILREGALALFGFPENVAKCKRTPEKMFRILDLYEAVSDLWPEIESIFSFESTSVVRSTAVNSLVRLGDAVRTMLTDFETAIQKDSSKTTVPGGGIHPLTRYVMNYISFLADYSGVLSDIVADWPLSVQSPLPESYFGSPDKDESISSPISVRLAWLILVMLCKLDGKAEMYKDVALSYLFLANNLQYVINKVRQSNLKLLLGDDWVMKHEQKVRKYASNYERMGWSKVIASLPGNPTAEIPVDQVIDHFRKFNSAFEEAYKKQSFGLYPTRNSETR